MGYLLFFLLLGDTKSNANNTVLEIQARSTAYYDVETVLNGKKITFTSSAGGDQLHSKRFAAPFEPINSFKICHRLRPKHPKIPISAKGLGIALLNFYPNGKKVEVLRSVSPMTVDQRQSRCTEYSFNLLADAKGSYKIVDLAKSNELKDEDSESKTDDEDQAVAVMKTKFRYIENTPDNAPANRPAQGTTNSTASRDPEKTSKTQTSALGPIKEDLTLQKSNDLLRELNKLPDVAKNLSIPIWCGIAAFIFFILWCLWRLFEKSGEPPILSVIPLVNLYIVWKISGVSSAAMLMILVPPIVYKIRAEHSQPHKMVFFVAIILGFYWICLGLARRFRGGYLFGLGLLLMPWAFLPYIAFREPNDSRKKSKKPMAIKDVTQPNTYYLDDL